MPVEPYDGSALPSDLVETNPLSDDPVAQGDDHLRLLKIATANFYTAYLAAMAAVDARLDAAEAAIANGSVYDAARLGGQLPAFYRDASNMNAGVLPAARLSGDYGINITGNAATATLATEATHAANADEALLAADSTKLGGMTLAQLQATLSQRITWSSIAVPAFTNAYTKIADINFAEAIAAAKFITGEFQCTVNVSGPGIPVFTQKTFGAYIRAVPSNKTIGFLHIPSYSLLDVGASTSSYLNSVPVGAGSLSTAVNANPVQFRRRIQDSDVYYDFGVIPGNGYTLRIPVTASIPAGTTGLEVFVMATSGGSAGSMSFEGIMQ